MRWREMIDHRFAQRRMSAYVDDELTGGERRRLERHAADCPDCGPLLRGLLQVRSALRSIGRAPDERVSIVPLVLERVRGEPAPPTGADRDEAAP